MSIRAIQVTDKTGLILKQMKFPTSTNQVSIDIDNLKSGMYFIRVYNGEEWKSESIIKQ